MAAIKTKGLVLRQSDFGESNRVLTIFTRDYGIISAAAYGAKSIRNKNSAAAQVMTYSDFVLTKSGRDMLTVQSAEAIDSFFGVKEDIAKLSLCVYLADLVYALINQNSPDTGLLSLLLNSVYALSYKNAAAEKVRAVFELRAMAMEGYMPNLSCCVKCSETKNITAFSVQRGGIVCSDCKYASDFTIDAQIYHTIAYILSADSKKMLSFEASDEIINKIGIISEAYVNEYCEKKLESLDYYKKMLII